MQQYEFCVLQIVLSNQEELILYAIMLACLCSTPWFVCDCRAEGIVGPDCPAELHELLQAVLQAADDRVRSLQERVQQQQADLQTLHHALQQSTARQETQSACFEHLQVCLCRH